MYPPTFPDGAPNAGGSNSWLPVFIFTAIVGYPLWTAIYNLLFHPLSRFPGPRLWAVTRIPYTRMYLSGKAPQRILELHQTYGPIVRIAPEILSFNHPDAMKENRGHRKHGASENGKDPIHMAYARKNIIGANREDHARYRRTLAHGFSAQAMMNQQPIILKYVNMLFKRLDELAGRNEEAIDLVSWFNYTTFDIIGDLSFGEPFGCLENSDYHPWVKLIFDSLKNVAWAVNLNRYALLARGLKLLIPKEISNKLAENKRLTQEKVRKRLDMGQGRPDFMEVMMSRGDSKGEALTFEELADNATTLIVGGSETTATLLSAATFFLATHPDSLMRLANEVRSAFSTEEEIDLITVQNLPFMLAVLDESMRLYPPVPSGSPRMINEMGDTILGRFIPPGTVAEVWHWALYHNPEHFSQPDEFRPERWLGDPRFAGDKKESFQPFSIGPRNCLGRNLAYAGMRIILAKLVWKFDFKLSKQNRDWYSHSRVYMAWQKEPLYVHLMQRTMSS